MKLHATIFFVYCGSFFDKESKNNLAVTNTAMLFLTTVYPTSGTGTDGDDGNKRAISNAILSGND